MTAPCRSSGSPTTPKSGSTVTPSPSATYFTQPLEFSRYLAAERLVDGADLTREQRAEILGAIAQAIVAQPGAVPQDPQQQPAPGNGR